MTLPQPFILALKLDQALFATFDELRQEYFPPQRNFLAAHITLFHALPAEYEPEIRQTLADVCAATAPLALAFPRLRFLGKGVAAEIEAPDLVRLQRKLTAEWRPWLSAQDQQGYRPHITIQNKVAPDQARQLFAELSASWKPLQGRGEGLTLWRYLGGPWGFVADFPFGLSL